MTKKGLENTAVSLVSMTAGAMASRIVADKLPLKNSKLKRGALILAGVLGASALDRKNTGRKIGQDMAISVAVTQTGHLLKEVLEEKLKNNKTLAPALGSPMGDWDNPIVLDSTNFLSGYTPNYDGISEDIIFEDVQEFAS